MTDAQETANLDVSFDLEITKIERRISAPGTWVYGRLSGHRFNALVFPEHAENPEWELDDSRISKLWVQRVQDQQTVFNWDRGMDIPAADATVQAIVGFLLVGIADVAYPNEPKRPPGRRRGVVPAA